MTFSLEKYTWANLKPTFDNAICTLNTWRNVLVLSGQSYKHFTLVNYDSRVVPDLKLPHITILES